MKPSFLVILFCLFPVSCSSLAYVTLEDRVLSEEDLMHLQVSVEESGHKVIGSQGGSKSTNGGFWTSSSKWKIVNQFLCDSKVKEEAVLLDDYRAHLIEVLEATGAKVEKDLEWVGADAEVTRLGTIGWDSGFTLVYKKSRVAGGVSVDYKVSEDGRSYFYVTNFENQ